MARRRNKNNQQIKNKDEKVKEQETLDPEPVVKFLSREPFFPLPLRVTPKVVQKWLNAMAPGTSNQTRKDVVVEMLARLRTTAYVILKHFV